ncbi:MAG: bifunctional methylenetetrahydrofolate dehydrogenase/methenyltetrahydrofolate cyclohydrolase FolD [Candidatus Margulisiibacteriota bacterium]
MSKIIDGKEMAEGLRKKLAIKAEEFVSTSGRIPKLAVILVGDNPASQVYVRMKKKACEETGMRSVVMVLPEDSEEKEVISAIESLNGDDSVHGILVQLPLPRHISEKNVINVILPEKDVDGLHNVNMGKLIKGEEPLFLPCTPAAIIELVLSTGVEIKGKQVVVVGRSNIVGKPAALLLLQRHATVTICHSRTVNLAGVASQADILIAAIGKPRMITLEMVKPGAVVIDVGVNRTDAGLIGDVDFDGVKDRAGFITPVPGGVGPMTIAMLLKNTLIAAQLANARQFSKGH